MRRVFAGALAVFACGALAAGAESVARLDAAGVVVGAQLPGTFAAAARQSDEGGSGPAALAFIALALGHDVTPAQVASFSGSGAVPASLLELQRAAGRLGFESRRVTVERIEQPGWHVLHLRRLGAGGHFVAARRVGRRTVQVFDPARGEHGVVEETALARVWKGDALWIEAERR